MGRGNAGRINKPKAAPCKQNHRKGIKLKIKALKHTTSSSYRSDATLLDTTHEILRQCRTNPKANVHLSGKKKRSLRKEAKRVLKTKCEDGENSNNMASDAGGFEEGRNPKSSDVMQTA